MKGYKAMESDMTCRGYQYEIGKTFEMDCNPKLCSQGFHFCATVADCYNYYDMSDDTRIFEIEAIGDIDNDGGDKYCTNKIVIVSEVTEEYIRKANTNSTSSGYLNSGNWNSGDLNSGNWNSGNWNSGYLNSGYRNSGDRNSGDLNSGNWNSGNWNSGYRNSGDCNSGNWNSGNWNSGDCNVTNNSSGIFNTEKQNIIAFDAPTNMTLDEWRASDAYYILRCMPIDYDDITFVDDCDMTEGEKKNHPEYVTIGGYLKKVHVEADVQDWYDKLPCAKKDIIKNIPNFDAEKFYKCTGIRV